MNLLFEIGDERWRISCDARLAPRTLAALKECLPLPLQLHTPKIAGSHIYWHAPFIEPVEGGMPVLNAPPGAFIYWPVRQFLEITYAPLQAETATVTVLGQLDGPADGIARLADRLRRQQGRRLLEGTLSSTEPVAAHPLRTDPPALAGIRAARRRLWASCPGDVTALGISRALMHPAGPVFTADGEARTLHESLWWIRERRGSEDPARLALAAGLALDRVATRLRDFCHFTVSAALLFDLAAAMDSHPDAFDLWLDEAILCAGRLSAWIDLQIPWNAVNEGFRAALDAPAAAPIAREAV